MAIFGFRAEVGTSGDGEFAVFSSKFGDGYSQDTPNGLNNETQKWSVKVSSKGGSAKTVQQALDFIRAQKGLPFQWRAPNTTGLGWYACKRYSQSDEGGDFWTLTMQFEQAYRP
jgi:Phage-related protein